MFFKHPTIIRRLTSRLKTLFTKKSPEIYPEVLYPGGDCSLSIFRRFILTAHSQSENGLENAELCRITEIRGLKYLLSDRGQSEHLAVAVIKNTAKAYVIFQRFSRKPLIECSARSSFGSVFSSSASASTHSSSTPTLPLASVYIPEDHVSLHHYRFPSSRYPWTWSMKFKNPIPFYVALSIASAISAAFPEYHPSEENRYFLVQVFFEILKKHNADDILKFKQGGSEKNKNGSARSGRSTDLPILSEEELAEGQGEHIDQTSLHLPKNHLDF
ncbi:hypothetical protein C0993_007472 [Termitomyces sp. T159_Od127]|nr:hypothetical protein C0993_007472 [Termitomyces sp. T159_Od127]